MRVLFLYGGYPSVNQKAPGRRQSRNACVLISSDRIDTLVSKKRRRDGKYLSIDKGRFSA